MWRRLRRVGRRPAAPRASRARRRRAPRDARHAIDAIVLVDGGIDALLRGDERSIGTPPEDLATLAAVTTLTAAPTRILACVGMGAELRDGSATPTRSSLDGACGPGQTDSYTVYIRVRGLNAPGFECTPYTLSYFFDAGLCR